MKQKFLFFIFILAYVNLLSQVRVAQNQEGHVLVVNNKHFVVNGMNWDYFPIGTNFNYSIWEQNEDVIKAALDREMSLLRHIGVNSIRVYTGIPKKWITYIYETYGIYTMLNHSFGRYGLNIDGVWIPNTDYADPKTRELLLREVKELAESYKDTPGLLLYLLGNENNYGLFWDGAETEDIPMEDRKSTIRARFLYTLFNEAAIEMKNIDKNHPIALCNGDLLFLDLITEECEDVDILGLNVYRGASFTDLYKRVKKENGKPVLLTEFGSDAFNSRTNSEDQESQAYYLTENWKEIYSNVYGMGNHNNSLGGYTFQFSDGWWKNGQTEDLDIHNTEASWSNGGYKADFVEGENNMNEEWFGICAKGPTDNNGLYELYPRMAYYALKEIHQFNPFEKNQIKSNYINKHFNSIDLTQANLYARRDKAALESSNNNKIRLSNLRTEFTTFNTGGSLISTPDKKSDDYRSFPNYKGFDHMESFYVGVEANPSKNMRANININILGNVAENPIDEIFYENRGRAFNIATSNGIESVQDNNRVQVYSASYNWDHKWFDLTGFYRTGHYHWGYEGDLFGLYQEANYGENINIYNGIAPFGFEIEGKKQLSGLKAAFGPELWWGANPAILLKYSKKLGDFNITAIYHEDLDQRDGSQSSFAIPQPKTRRTTLAIQREFGAFKVDLGGIWAGEPLNGSVFQLVRDNQIYQSTISGKDNWGGKIKLTYDGNVIKWYTSAAASGLVANGGPDQTQTFTGWKLKDNGSGNQYIVLAGFAFNIGNLQIAPNFLWQKPIEGPITPNIGAPARPRNILDDPFAVRVNREQTAGEILFTFDPTPATWYYQWDNDRTEDAKFAFNLGYIFRHYPTSQDAAIGILADGRTLFAFPGAPPAADLWEIHSRIVSKIHKNLGFIANIYGGPAQANGSDTRKIKRFGTDIRMVYNKLKLMSAIKVNDWGPYDYHRDFNLTYPLQLVADLSIELNNPDWFVLPGTRLGIRTTYRTLNKYSPRYSPTTTINAAGNWIPDPNAIGFPNGNEWEIRTYIHINVGK